VEVHAGITNVITNASL